MRFEAKLAFKYFRARRKGLARFTSGVAVLGVAAGVASLILASSLARGFADEMRDKILANTAHIYVASNDGAAITEWREVKARLEKSANVSAVSATAYESVIIVSAQETNYAVLRAAENNPQPAGDNLLEKNTERQPTNSEYSIKTEDRPIEVSVGKELAEKANLKTGDSAEIFTAENEFPTNMRKVFIAEIFQTGLYEYDSTWIKIAPENYARLKNRSDFAPTILSVSVKDIYAANQTADEMRKDLGERFKVVDWQAANQPLFAALSLERRAALAIISLIIFIAALNITTTLALLVGERRLDIAILRTCGTKTRNLVFIFLVEGVLLGAAGIFFGVAFGLLGCALGNRFHVVQLSKEVYSLGSIPFHSNFGTVVLTIFIAFALTLAATVYPAWRASRIKPLENLRRQ